MIGLVDLPLQQWDRTGLCPPDLEIMKLAAYYQQEENTFCRLINLTETSLDSYDKIYVFSEYPQYTEIPDAFKKQSNVIYGGAGFTNGVYKPFDNTLIDFTLPSINIYKNFLKDKYTEGIAAKLIQSFLDDTYYRISIGTTKLPIPPIKTGKHVYIYDTNLFVDGWENIIEKISERRPASIRFIHPIICTLPQQYFQVRAQDKIVRGTAVLLDFNLALAEMKKWIEFNKRKLLADLTVTSNVFLPLGGEFNSIFAYYNDFIYKLNILYCFWSQGIPIKISYQQPLPWSHDPLAVLSKLVETWANGATNKKKTLRERFPNLKRKKETPQVWQEYNNLLRFHPNAKDLFDQNFTVLKQGGYWRI